MKLRPRTLVIVVLVALVAGGSWKFWQTRRAASAATAAPASAVRGATIELAPEDVFTLAPVELGRTVAVSGSLKPVASAWVKAKVAGELRELGPREGDAVRAGQVIGRIDTREYDLRAEQARRTADAARAQADITRRQLDNNRALVEQGFVSPTALDTAQANDQAARANLQAAESAVELARKSQGDAVLRAPLDGIVAQRLAQPGERVAIDARLVEIVDLRRLELEAAVPPAEAVALRVGQRARLQVEGLEAPLDATVTRISPSTQSGSRAVLAYLGLPDTAGLRSGLFARGRVEIDRATVLAAPVTAVRRDDSTPQVLALRADAQGGLVVRRLEVRTGRRGAGPGDEELLEVIGGVQAGERLLRGSVGTLPDGTPARLQPARAGEGASAAAAAASH